MFFSRLFIGVCRTNGFGSCLEACLLKRSRRFGNVRTPVVRTSEPEIIWSRPLVSQTGKPGSMGVTWLSQVPGGAAARWAGLDPRAPDTWSTRSLYILISALSLTTYTSTLYKSWRKKREPDLSLDWEASSNLGIKPQQWMNWRMFGRRHNKHQTLRHVNIFLTLKRCVILRTR